LADSIDTYNIIAYRLHSHHLDTKVPAKDLTEAAGACGLQNSPPGAWETALFNRLEDVSLSGLQDALYREKSVVQAWSYRGVPVVFPADQTDLFLTALIPKEGEEPWIYTRGITLALDCVRMTFDELLPMVIAAAGYLGQHTVKSKEVLDRVLADIVSGQLPADKKKLWQGPSMYGSPDKQTVGEAIVSFMLRPCSHLSLVVFGEREGISPTFTSFQNWMGHSPVQTADAGAKLVRKYLSCYGPAGEKELMAWLGCSPQQARRLWNTVKEELRPVKVNGKLRYILDGEEQKLRQAKTDENRILLLGAHDPYLDLKDRELILEDKERQKAVWRTVGNPGAVLRGGKVIGLWKVRTQKDRLHIQIKLWEHISAAEYNKAEQLADEYAAFRQAKLADLRID
jgi:hypothetical protein